VIPAVTATDGARSLAERYEQLREAVLTSSGRRAPGLASVRRQGLWAWVELVRTADDVPPRPAALALPPRRPTPRPAVQAELVPVWVNLVLGQAIPLESR